MAEYNILAMVSTRVDVSKLENLIEPEEVVIASYIDKTINKDYVVFTNKRVIIKETSTFYKNILTHTIPYKSIISFTVELEEGKKYAPEFNLRTNVGNLRICFETPIEELESINSTITRAII